MDDAGSTFTAAPLVGNAGIEKVVPGSGVVGDRPTRVPAALLALLSGAGLGLMAA